MNPEGSDFVLLETQIAGLQHHTTPDEVLACCASTEVKIVCDLVREPKNSFDVNAIKVVRDKKHLGYVPAVQAVWIARLLDAGYPMHAVVEAVDVRLPKRMAVDIALVMSVWPTKESGQ